MRRGHARILVVEAHTELTAEAFAVRQDILATSAARTSRRHRPSGSRRRTMVPRADAPAATPKRELVPRRGNLPPAAMALAWLIGEALAEWLWAAVQGDAVAALGATADAEAARTLPGVRGSRDRTGAKQ